MASVEHVSSSSTDSLTPPPIFPTRARRLSSIKSDLIKFEVECLKFILKETVDKLIIANGGEKATLIHPSDTKLPMKIRYRESREKMFHEETLEPINEAMERMVFVKLGNDVSRLRKILSDTIDDLVTTNDFKGLKILIDTEIRLEAEEKNLIEQNAKCERLYRFLEKKFDEDTKMYKSKVKEIDDTIAEVEAELNDLKVENKIKMKLLSDWEKTRHGQIKFITENKEKLLLVTAENFKKDAYREIRLKHEIESYLENQTAYYEDLTRQWVEKYEKEVKQLDEQINETKDLMISLRIKYDDMVEQFNMREEEIQDYLEEKKMKQDAAEKAEREYQAIVKIQSWWKGIMVRRGLGPYRRKKVKGAKKGKKAAKKK
ncbi:dynein regulatory complex protein 9-like [Chironomus tepperi]|uniref:dynein regulatory complex protein 9-like n=1 Tax=Chironomus tepperi TaxID=113505 RepID=UPI00391F7CB2